MKLASRVVAVLILLLFAPQLHAADQKENRVLIALNGGAELRAKPEEDKSWRTDVLFGYGTPNHLVGAGFGRISRSIIPFSKLKDVDATAFLDTLVQARGVLHISAFVDVDLVRFYKALAGKSGEPAPSAILSSLWAPRESGAGLFGRIEGSYLALPAKDAEKAEHDTEATIYAGLFGADDGYLVQGSVGYGLTKNPFLDRGFDATKRLKWRADMRTPYGKVLKSLHMNAFAIIQEDLPLEKGTFQLDDGSTVEKWPPRELVVYLGGGIDIHELFKPSDDNKEKPKEEEPKPKQEGKTPSNESTPK